MGLTKIAGYSWCEVKLYCNKTPFLLGIGKRWVSFLAVSGYFVKMNSPSEKPPTDYLCIIERFLTVLFDSPYEGGFVPAQFKGHISRFMF